VPALLPDPGDEDSEDGEAGLEATGSRYETVLRVVRAMCAHDDDLTQALQDIRARRAADPDDQPPGLPPQVTVLAPPGALQATLDALRIQVLTRTTSSWWDGYGHARGYHAARGDLDVPVAFVTGSGFPLGAWLTAQRAARNRGEVPDERVRLDVVGMTWDPAGGGVDGRLRRAARVQGAARALRGPGNLPDRRRDQAQRMAGHPARRRPRRETRRQAQGPAR
jgi:hypothetical protein